MSYHVCSTSNTAILSSSFFQGGIGRGVMGRRRFRGEAARWGWLETSHDVAVVPTTACEETMLALN